MIRWKRTPLGYLSEDGRWFLERGAPMSHGANAWLIWRKAEKGEVVTDDGPSPYSTLAGQPPVRSLRYLTGLPALPETLFIDTLTEGGWLSEAKRYVEKEETCR